MTTFLRLLETDAREKGVVLRSAATRWRSGSADEAIFSVAPSLFRHVPGTPFAYWVSDNVRQLFTSLEQLEAGGRRVERGMVTTDDFRFIRLEWEISPTSLAADLSETHQGQRWARCTKGGSYSPFYGDLHLVVNWQFDAREIGAVIVAKYPYLNGDDNWVLHRECSYFQPGVTWPLRTTSAFGPRILPGGAVFSAKGPTVFSEGTSDGLLCILALMLSRPFAALVELQLAAGAAAARSYEIGLIKRTPVPVPFASEDARVRLTALAQQAWYLERSLDTARQTSHAFTVPALLQANGPTLETRADAWSARLQADEIAVAEIRSVIDDIAYDLYGINGEDRRRMADGFNGIGSVQEVSDSDDADDAEIDVAEEADISTLMESLFEWALGTALGRFDIRLATGNREPPSDPNPFDPLPVCSPGMLQEEGGLPALEAPSGYPLELPRYGILVDDPGHPWDIVARIETVFDLIAGDRAHGWIREAEGILGRDLRDWLRRHGFERHLKRYSRSRRKAPLFWHLAPKSREYGIWLYNPVATRDTFYRIQNDYVEPKLKAAERRMLELRQLAGASPMGQQRKDLTAQESLVEELRAFREQVVRIAPLWKPFRDDGVVLNCAVLSPLFDHHRAWQNECAQKWGELKDAKYDWAGWAMHLWPERVVAACATDRSIAIAHGLEEALWVQGDDGKWERRADVDEQIATLTAERRSPALQAALEAFNAGLP